MALYRNVIINVIDAYTSVFVNIVWWADWVLCIICRARQ